VSRLGSRPERLLQSETPSPGEVRKMLLASSIAADPYVIMLDEPTNHLDLPSIECLEHALQETRAALLIVSHDPRFLQSLTEQTWMLVPGAQGEVSLTFQYTAPLH
jgi:ATPase subunit of ABC transporter with duplicated ATPase domains